MDQILIYTERLTIKPISLSDASDMFDYRSDESVSRFQNFKPKTIAEIEKFIKHYTKSFNEEDSWFQAGVYLNTKMIGDIGIHFLGPENRQCEIGYTISPRYQKNGYGKESVSAMVHYLFGKLKKHRITASLDPRNAASIALLESIGFRKEGLFRKSILNNGGWEDDLVYAVLDEEWE